MTEDQIKFLCKQLAENTNRPLSDFDKELIKQAIDKAKSVPKNDFCNFSNTFIKAKR